MHYCLSSHVGQEYLKKADEIKVNYNKLDSILDLFEINPNATFILSISSKVDKNTIKWTEIENYNIMTQNKLVIATDSFDIMDACKALNIKFFYSIPVNSFYDLKALVDYGCCDVRIDAPLTHMLDKLEDIDITIRMSPNIAYYAYIPRKDGVIGSWVRPEDIEIYEEYVDVFEFEDCDKKKEEALYRIYAENKRWLGLVGDLITNLNYTATNRLILPEFGQLRAFCGQKCARGLRCNACYRMLNLADPDKIEKIKAKIESDKKDKENKNENLNI